MSSHSRFLQRIFVIGLIVIGILFTAFFGMRALHAFRKFNGHPPPPPGKVETDVELIRDWMTVPFISRTYQVPPEVIFEALNISPQTGHKKSLKDLNKEFYPDKSGYVLSAVKETIIAYYASNPPPTAPVKP
jgi:hypothetical protein